MEDVASNMYYIGLGGIFCFQLLTFFWGKVDKHKDAQDTKAYRLLQSDAANQTQHLHECHHDERREARELAKMTKDLHDWHNVQDDEGVKVWYVRKSLEQSIDRLAASTEKTNEVLQALHTDQADSRRDMVIFMKAHDKTQEAFLKFLRNPTGSPDVQN